MGSGSEHDEHLVQRLRDGDHHAWRALYRRHREDVYRHAGYANVRGCTPQDAEDITQDTFVRAYRSIHDFAGRSSLKTWLIAITGHAARDHFRRRRTRYGPPTVHEAIGHYTANDVQEALHGPVADVQQCIEQHQQRDQFRAYVAQLDRSYRAVITFRVVDGLSVRETAEAMGRSEGAVKMLLKRAIESLSRIAREQAGPAVEHETREERGHVR